MNLERVATNEKLVNYFIEKIKIKEDFEDYD